MKLADKIILLRKQKGWSQEELAAQMDVSRQSVSKWESGASVPDIDKILLLSQIFGTTTDFLLKDDVETSEETDCVKDNNMKKEIPKRHITKQEATDFLGTRKKAAPKMALSVWFCIVSPALMLALLGFAKAGEYSITEELAVAIGLGALFVFVTIAVSMFIVNGMKLSKYEYIEKEVVILDNELSDQLKMESEKFMSVFSKNIALGVVLCIVSVIPLITLSITKNELYVMEAVALLLIIVAFGVYRFVRVGIIKASYDQILQREDYTASKKTAKKKMDPIASVYWMVVTIIYLVTSFMTDRWEISWLIWPVAGIMFGIIAIIIENKDTDN